MCVFWGWGGEGELTVKEGISGGLLSEFDEEILETELHIKSKIRQMKLIQGHQSIDEYFDSN